MINAAIWKTWNGWAVIQMEYPSSIHQTTAYTIHDAEESMWGRVFNETEMFPVPLAPPPSPVATPTGGERLSKETVTVAANLENKGGDAPCTGPQTMKSEKPFASNVPGGESAGGTLLHVIWPTPEIRIEVWQSATASQPAAQATEGGQHPAPTGEAESIPCGGCGAKTESERCLNCRHVFREAESSAPTAKEVGLVGKGIYIASKVRHAAKWRDLRSRGVPVISTWIDEAGEGETGDWPDLWSRCVSEAKNARWLIVYREGDEVLKGALVEVGAALALGVPVIAVGDFDSMTWLKHHLVTSVLSMHQALAHIESHKVTPHDNN